MCFGIARTEFILVSVNIDCIDRSITHFSTTTTKKANPSLHLPMNPQDKPLLSYAQAHSEIERLTALIRSPSEVTPNQHPQQHARRLADLDTLDRIVAWTGRAQCALQELAASRQQSVAQTVQALHVPHALVHFDAINGDFSHQF